MSTYDSHTKDVFVSDLMIDSRIQRQEGADQRRVDHIAGHFNPAALGTIIVSLRDNGDLAILDGMHRSAGAKKAGYDGPIKAQVFVGLTLAEEAELFLLFNNTKSPSAITKFVVKVVTGDPSSVELDSIIRKHGWRIRASVQPGSIAAVEALEKVYRRGGGPLAVGRYPLITDKTLAVITEAWGHDFAGANGHIIGGLGQVFARFEDSVDQHKLVTEIAHTMPTTLVARAKQLRDVQGGTVPAAMAKILAGLHNNRRRTNLLPDWVWIR